MLAPAYHCRTMIDPAVRVGGDVLLYRLDQRLAPDWAALDHLVSHSERPVRAMLLTHYFGFLQDVRAARAFCTKHGIALIEDCSHAFIYSSQDTPPGTLSQYVVASPYKFCPCDDGGLLIGGSGSKLPERALRSPGVAKEIRALVHTIERALILGRGRAREVEPLAVDPRALAVGNESEEAGDTISSMYDTRSENDAGFLVSRLIMRMSNVDRIAEARRQNYMQWVRAVSDLPGCHALFPEPPDACAPYMFPLYIDHPSPHFYVLKHLGMPIWRWDEMAVSDCPVATDYRLHLLHLPCHQGLSIDEMKWMTATVSRVMNEMGAEQCR